MRNNENIYDFLLARGFVLIKEDTSAFFGDYCDIFSTYDFQIRFSSSKSFKTVDIRNNKEDESWFDLGLVKALLYSEKILNNVVSLEEHNEFLQKELANIANLFDNQNYQATKKRLEELENERVRQMFPSEGD